MSNNERLTGFSPEKTPDPKELEKAREQGRERIGEHLEQNAEKTPETNAETARHEALELSKSHEQEARKQETEVAPTTVETDSGMSRKARLEQSYDHIMGEVRPQLNPASRAFSKVIHNKAVEKTSEIVGTTVARPNAILAGAVFAFALTLAVYLIGKQLGYPLSGAETIVAFVLGWVIGIIYDFLKVMITGKKST